MILYNVYIGGDLVLDTDNGINKGILTGELSLEINTAGSFNFTLSKKYPNIDKIERYGTIVAVRMTLWTNENGVEDDIWPFAGRIVSIEDGMDGVVSFQAEGGLAFLKDVYYSYIKKDIATNAWTTNQLMRNIGGVYNELIEATKNDPYMPNPPLVDFHHVIAEDDYSKFMPGYVNIYPSERDNETVITDTCYNIIQDLLIERSGGFIGVTYYPFNNDTNVNYMDYFDGCTFAVLMHYYPPYRNFVDVEIQNEHIGIKRYDWSTHLISYGRDGMSLPQDIHTDIAFAQDQSPWFSFDKNILQLEKTPIKDDIWTCLFPFGENEIRIIKPNRHAYTYSDEIIPIDFLTKKYGLILKNVSFSTAKDRYQLQNDAEEYIRNFMSCDWYSVYNYTIHGIEPCLVGNVTEYSRNILRLGDNITLKVDRDTDGNYIDKYTQVIAIKHDIFDATKSEYTCGPTVSNTILREDLSMISRPKQKTTKTKVT